MGQLDDAKRWAKDNLDRVKYEEFMRTIGAEKRLRHYVTICFEYDPSNPSTVDRTALEARVKAQIEANIGSTKNVEVNVVSRTEY